MEINGFDWKKTTHAGKVRLIKFLTTPNALPSTDDRWLSQASEKCRSKKSCSTNGEAKIIRPKFLPKTNSCGTRIHKTNLIILLNGKSWEGMGKSGFSQLSSSLTKNQRYPRCQELPQQETSSRCLLKDGHSSASVWASWVRGRLRLAWCWRKRTCR